MQTIITTVHRESSHPASGSAPLIQHWEAFIRAMEEHVEAPERHTSEEVMTTARWAARFGLQPPALPARGGARHGLTLLATPPSV